MYTPFVLVTNFYRIQKFVRSFIVDLALYMVDFAECDANKDRTLIQTYLPWY